MFAEGVHNILVLVPDRFSYARQIQQGIHAYARQQANWRFVHGIDPYYDRDRVSEAGADGIIAFIDIPEMLEQVRKPAVPFVNVSGTMNTPPAPAVLTNNRQVGALAARHFLERGFQNFAFLGVRDRWYSDQRELGFREVLQAEGRDGPAYHRGGSRYRGIGTWTDHEPELKHWLDNLPRPLGLVTAVDALGVMVIDYAHLTGTRIPEDIAVIGVNNDDVACHSTQPELSSVESSPEDVGYRAAALLANLLDGARAPEEPVLLPPRRVVIRGSSDTVAIDDAETVEALRFIRLNVTEAINVDDVLEHVAVSRSSLERRFRRFLGRTPLEEIQRVRIERAKRLLIESDLPMNALAERSGFRTPQRMATIFGRQTGLSPTAFRQRYRPGAGG